MMKTKILKFVQWSLLLICLIASIYFVSYKQENLHVRNIRVKISNADTYGFVNKASVLKEVNKLIPNWKNENLNNIDKNKLENQITKNPFIANTEVYSLVSGDIVIEITQRAPIARLMGSRNYYIDSIGKQIPLSSIFTSRVLVISGDLNRRKFTKEFIAMLNFINKDDFLRAQITQISITRGGELIMIPRVGNHKIEFGTAKDYQWKFRKLLALYNKGFTQSGWNKYKTVNLKFSNQVVCTKR